MLIERNSDKEEDLILKTQTFLAEKIRSDDLKPVNTLEVTTLIPSSSNANN